ncbi:hypothetical protein H0H87_001773 [Tephrocybe sp. NHM501043]|nr:hypothetical protein H0H87_001773 [Tephrocybe sp. NHM501043]
MASFSMNTEPFSGVSFSDDCSGNDDVNFNIPLPATLETPRVKLTPFIPSVHGEAFYAGYSSAPELGRYLPLSLSTYSIFLSYIENVIRSDPGSVLFAIIDKTKGEDGELKARLAGIIGLLKCIPGNRAVEIGPVIILPAFQRSFVSSNAIGVLLKYLLDVPSEGGVGFRRVAWTANPLNQASVRAAERVGFRQEGTLRWTWCLPSGIKGGMAGEERGNALGRDSVMLALCWDDWENGGKEHVKNLIQRQ